MPSHKVHRRQLFHWIGSDIDAEADASNKLTDALRHKYLQYLKGAISNGLWSKTPRVPDQLGDGALIKVKRPITCFTEWSLNECLPHTRNYGRLGFGFPKRFVLERGGQPVAYIRDSTRNDPYTKSLLELARWLKSATPKTVGLTTNQLSSMRAHFDYLSHFNKRIRRAAAPIDSSKTLSRKVSSPIKPAARKLSPTQPDPFIRRYGPELHYLEEREWRIVYDQSLDKFFEPGSRPSDPDYFLPFEPGKNLFTVVVPDNAILNAAIHDKEIRSAFFPKAGPHVTILSLQDIGTF